jgi:hypothetical protein
VTEGRKADSPQNNEDALTHRAERVANRNFDVVKRNEGGASGG